MRIRSLTITQSILAQHWDVVENHLITDCRLKQLDFAGISGIQHSIEVLSINQWREKFPLTSFKVVSVLLWVKPTAKRHNAARNWLNKMSSWFEGQRSQVCGIKQTRKFNKKCAGCNWEIYDMRASHEHKLHGNMTEIQNLIVIN